MNKQTIITILSIFIIIGLLSFVIIGSKSKNNIELTAQKTPDIVSVDDENPIFFYGNTCPHCKDIENWMEENNIEKKLTITKKEVYNNQLNAQELNKVALSCGLDTSNIGVPFLYTTDHECLIGTPDITTYLTERVTPKDISTTATDSAEGSQK